jgi:hypothetical protein
VAELGTSEERGGDGVDVLGLQEVVFGGHGHSQTELFATTVVSGDGRRVKREAGDAVEGRNPHERRQGWGVAFEAPVPEPMLAGQADPSFRIDGNAILAHVSGGWSEWTAVPDTHR